MVALKELQRYSVISQGEVRLYYAEEGAKIKIAESAIRDLIHDMYRSYETAGMLAGNVGSDGTILFTKYIKAEGVIRYSASVHQKFQTYKEQLEKIASEGYDAEISLHTHPIIDKHSIGSTEMLMIEKRGLNNLDKKAAMLFHKPTAEEIGFRAAFEGVFEIRFRIQEDNEVVTATDIAIFDIDKSTESTENFTIVHDENAEKRYLLKKVFRSSRKLVEGISAKIRDPLTTKLVNIEIPFGSQAPDDFSNIKTLLALAKVPEEKVTVSINGDKLNVTFKSTPFTRLQRKEEQIVENILKVIGGFTNKSYTLENETELDNQ
ncbi:MAG: hypothetical protein ACP5K9_01310 [Candidatus Micrarchaeia archaeon]